MVAVFQNPQRILAERRLVHRAGKRAINYTLEQLPVSLSGRLAREDPDAENLLVAVDRFCDALPAYHPVKMMRADVIEYIRPHPDVAGLQALFEFTDEALDQIFEGAMAFDQVAP